MFLFTLANLIHSFNRTTNFLPLLNTVHLFLRNNLSPPKDIFLSLVPLFRNFQLFRKLFVEISTILGWIRFQKGSWGGLCRFSFISARDWINLVKEAPFSKKSCPLCALSSETTHQCILVLHIHYTYLKWKTFLINNIYFSRKNDNKIRRGPIYFQIRKVSRDFASAFPIDTPLMIEYILHFLYYFWLLCTASFYRFWTSWDGTVETAGTNYERYQIK